MDSKVKPVEVPLMGATLVSPIARPQASCLVLSWAVVLSIVTGAEWLQHFMPWTARMLVAG